MEDMIKTNKFLKDSDLLIKSISEIIEAKEQKVRFSSMVLGAFGANLLAKMLVEKRVKTTGYGRKVKGKGKIRAGQDF